MKRLVIFASALFSLCTAHASAVSASLTYDLGILGNVDGNSGGPVVIANGDNVTLTVNFKNNLALTIGDAGTGEYLRAWLYGTDNNSNFTINNIVLDLLGFSETGGAASHYVKATESNGAAHIGSLFLDFLAAGQSVTFSGYKLAFDVQSIQSSPYTYPGTWVGAGGDVSVGPAGPLPEPGSMALVAVALAGLGTAARQRARS